MLGKQGIEVSRSVDSITARYLSVLGIGTFRLGKPVSTIETDTMIGRKWLEKNVHSDVAACLYQNVPTVLWGMVTASTALMLICSEMPNLLPVMAWWAVLNGILLVRLLDYLKVRKAQDSFWEQPQRMIRRYCISVIATSSMWAIYPVMFFNGQPAQQRMFACIVILALASTGSAMLGSLYKMALLFASLLVLPTAGMLFASGDRLQISMAMLGLVLYVTVLFTARHSGRVTLRAFRTKREHEKLAVDFERKNIEAANLNDSLRAAQQQLLESNQRLELRVHERTQALRFEAQEKATYARRLEKLASCDPLTHLLNRTALVREASLRMQDSPCELKPMKCLFIDLDRFKEVNDVLGHFIGDAALFEVASRIKQALPADAIVGRWGGDEFVALVPQGRDDGDLLMEANLIRARLASPLKVGNNEIRLDASIGISLAPQHEKTTEDLIRNADMAMYSVKLQGRSGASLYEASMAESTRKKHEIGQALRQALALNQLSLAYQPIVHAKSGKMHCMEALLRWSDPILGIVSPAEFIPIAEDNGLIIPLGRWVLEQACAAASQWPDKVVVAVNVSVAQIVAAEDFLAAVDEALSQSGLSADRLEIEVTETLFAHNIEHVSVTLQALRDRGISVAIDDFGTGYSSLGYLARLPVDVIKIDRSFVNDIETCGDAIIQAILGVAHGLGFSVVAEGVETRQQRQVLEALNVDFLQGYLLSRPIPHRDVKVWLQDYANSVTEESRVCC